MQLKHSETMLDKIRNASSPMAVFAFEGEAHMTKTATNNFAEQFARHPDRLVGVYDKNCTLELLEGDLKEAGVQ